MTVRRARYAAARIRKLQTRHGTVTASSLKRFFDGQARRVVARYKLGHPELLPEDELLGLAFVLEPRIKAMAVEAELIASALAGFDEFLDENDPRLLSVLMSAVLRIRRIHERTRQAAYNAVRVGEEAGYSRHEIIVGVPQKRYRGLEESVREVYEGRHETIARTEMAYASQESVMAALQSAGITEVDVSDGPGCGWAYHDDPDKADGTRRPLQEAIRHPIAHVNCVRVCTPALAPKEGARHVGRVRVGSHGVVRAGRSLARRRPRG